MRLNIRTLIAGAAFATVGAANAIDFFETEGNDTRATANMFTGLVNGDAIVGNSISASTTGLDYFKVSTAPTTLGIYRHRLKLETAGTAGHTGTLRGFSVSGGIAGTTAGTVSTTSDATLQTSTTTSTPARFNQWYGFGKGEIQNYRVTGGATTTADYRAVLETVAVTPTNLGVYQAGTFNFSTYLVASNVSGTSLIYSDTEIYLFDSNFNTTGSWNNDDYFPQTTTHPFHSELNLTLAPGTYYFAVSRFNTANNIVADPTNENGPNDAVQEFGDSLLHSSATITAGSPLAPINLSFNIINNGGPAQLVSGAMSEAYGVNWYCLEVVPEPGTMIALGAGAAALLRKRRKA